MMAPLPMFLALVLAVAAAHKAQSGARLGIAAARLAGVSPSTGQLLLVVAGAAEAIAAICLVIPAATVVGALIAALVCSAYALALWRRRGETHDSGCDIAARPRPIGRGQILRAAVLAGLAALLLVLPAPAGISPAEALLTAFAFLALYFGASELLSIPHPAWRKS